MHQLTRRRPSVNDGIEVAAVIASRLAPKSILNTKDGKSLGIFAGHNSHLQFWCKLEEGSVPDLAFIQNSANIGVYSKHQLLQDARFKYDEDLRKLKISRASPNWKLVRGLKDNVKSVWDGATELGMSLPEILESRPFPPQPIRTDFRSDLKNTN